MHEGLTIFDILLIAGLIIFIFTRFTGDSLPKDDNKNKPNSTSKGGKEKNITKVVSLSKVKDKKEAEKKSKSKEENLAGVDAIKDKDPSFNETEFLEGAKEAYKMFYDALSRSDEDLLDDLTSPRVYDQAIEKVEEAEAQGYSYKAIVDKIKNASVVDARLHGLSFVVDVKYEATLFEYTEDEKGDVVEGSKTKSKAEQVVWTWVKPIDNNDPNWELDDIHVVS